MTSKYSDIASGGGLDPRYQYEQQRAKESRVSKLEGFEPIDRRARRRMLVRIAPLANESRLTVSRWLLAAIGVKDYEPRVNLLRKGNVLVLSKGKTSSVDNGYSPNRVRIYMPKGVFAPGLAFDCTDVRIEGDLVFIHVPPEKMLAE